VPTCPKQSTSSFLEWPSGSLSTHSCENGTGFASGTNARGVAATGAAQACLPGTLRGVCERAEHARHPEPMQQAHKSTHKTQASTKNTICNHCTPTSLTHSCYQEESWAAQAGRELPSPSVFLCLSLCPPSSLSLAWISGRVYPGVPGTDNLIDNGPPGTKGLTPLQIGRGARRLPGKILTVFQMGFLELTVPVRFVLPCHIHACQDACGTRAHETEAH